jgi:hypothetical protein
MMKDAKYFRARLSALRNALDVLLAELDEIESDPAPRMRRNLTVIRMEEHETNHALGTWRKPKGLKKAK